jgi:ElaB/YqjD/DUF883 family membrane-anchored ribosome-binding protein
MITHANGMPSDNLADRAASSADQAIRSTQHAVNGALDSLASNVEALRHHTAPMLDRAANQAGALAHRGADGLRHTSQYLRDSARQTSDNTKNYIRDEPVKAVLIAAVTGAVLMALVSLLGYSRRQQ